jgi:DNA-binding NarL/FixJ family response regulator
VGEASNGSEAIEHYGRLKPDVTLMDLQLPGKSGIDAIREICADGAQARIIILTSHAGDAQALRAMRAGAVAYLLKSSVRHELAQVIRKVHAGGRHIPPEIAQGIAMHAIDDPLSDREIEVLVLVAEGFANKEVAQRLSIAEETAKAHVRSIFSKLNVTDRTHAVTVAVRRGIITL